MNEISIVNAVIEDASLGFGDRGFLDCWLQLKYNEAAGQGFGGFALYLPKSWHHHTLESPAGHFLYRVMEVAGVTDWGHVIGRTIRVKQTHSRVHAIGHIIKDDWFCPSEDFASLKKKEGA